MKRLITVLLVCIVTIGTYAQQKADIEVSYTEYNPNMRTGETGEVTHRYVLQTNTRESKFYSPRTEFIDSLNSSADGKAKYQEMTRAAYLGGKLKDMPRSDGSYYIVRSLPENKILYYDKVGLEKYFYEEIMPDWNWEIGDSTKTILGYECLVATTDFHGRRWTVWFTTDIPLGVGPWKLGGLPGLILEAVADDGQYRFVADGMQEANSIMVPVYLAGDYEKTERTSLLKAQRSFNDNPLGKINAQFAGKGVSISRVKNKDGEDVSDRLFVPREKVDFIETDY